MKKKGSLIGKAQKMIGYEIIETGKHIVVEHEAVEAIKKIRRETQKDIDDSYKIEYYDLLTDDNVNYYCSDIKKSIEFKQLFPIAFS